MNLSTLIRVCKASGHGKPRVAMNLPVKSPAKVDFTPDFDSKNNHMPKSWRLLCVVHLLVSRFFVCSCSCLKFSNPGRGGPVGSTTVF